MNKIYISKRASGKTTLLIKKSAETGAVIVRRLKQCVHISNRWPVP